MAYNNDFFRVRTVKDSLNEVLGSIQGLTLDDGKTVNYLKGVLNRYIDKLEGLVLYKTEGLSVTQQLEVDIAQAILLGLIAFYDGDTKIFTEVKRGYNFTEPKRENTFEEKL